MLSLVYKLLIVWQLSTVPGSFHHFPVETIFLLHQFIMRSLFGNLSVVNISNTIGVSYGPQPVGHHDRCHVLVGKSIESFLYDSFRFGIQS